MAPHFSDQSALRQDEEDDLEIARIVADEHGGLDFMSRSLEPGEKADDAVDYEDIGDDDLAEEIDLPTASGGGNISWLNGESDGEAGDDSSQEGHAQQKGKSGHAYDLDDLFGDIPSSTGLGDGINGDEADAPDDEDFPFDMDMEEDLPESSSTLPASGQAGEPASSANPLFRNVDFGAKEPDRFFDQLDSNTPPPPAENHEELVASLYPDFQPDKRPKMTTLFNYKRAYFVGKTPLRTPKPVIPTKISLELEPDQEKAFKINTAALPGKRVSHTDTSQKGIVPIDCEGGGEGSGDDDVDMDMGLEDGITGGISLTDLEIICDDWDSKIGKEASDSEPQENSKRARDDDLFGDDKWEKEVGITPAKKQKVAAGSTVESYYPHIFAFPSFDDPEEAAAKIARSVVLDLNDPHLLLDVHQPGGASVRMQDANGAVKSLANGASLKDRLKRYNISNDDAYDMLKENHGKVRSIIGNLRVEHGLPALRLQYPYYKTKLGVREARSFHRPVLSFRPNEMIRFKKPSHIKRKHLKGRGPESIFSTTKDLSLADNSHALLLEYSEEYPPMLSNFGMHNRILNYYRRKTFEDNARPKLELGETTILLPQDQSPFSIFGTVEPGQVTPALYNAMFKAPVFKQEAKPTDFLVIRNTTGISGSSWYIRNMEHVYVVGQEFPSVEVPGPHSRKVTTASKNRMKMIAYRKARRSATKSVPIADVTAHFPDTTDMQNRQKLKEFMTFSKVSKEWEMKDDETIPEEPTIRAMVPPEDVCLLESMQVGARQLADAGYGKDGMVVGSDDEEKDGQSIQQQLAPWETTKNFLNAAQGKAMLEVHGEGDPSGRGWAFSFVKVSMKGGFKSIGESVEDKLDSKRKAELGGHSYNVALQQKAYEDSISKVWEAQNKSLSSQIEPSEAELDDAHGDDVGEVFESEAATPAAWTHRGDDETTSQFSRISASSHRGKGLRITRRIRNKRGGVDLEKEVVRDPRVIRQYLKRRRDVDSERVQISNLPDKPTGRAEQDRATKKRIEEELIRLSRNKERRIAREKAKGIVPDGTASDIGSPTSGTPKTNGTKRKCANCGQVGHIKTNKKACPMLNGTMRPEDGLASNATGFGSMGTAPTS